MQFLTSWFNSEEMDSRLSVKWTCRIKMLTMAAHSELDEDDNDDMVDYVDYGVEIKDSDCTVLCWGYRRPVMSNYQLLFSRSEWMVVLSDPLIVVCSLFVRVIVLEMHFSDIILNINGLCSFYDFGQSVNCLRSPIVIRLTRTREN